MFLGKLGKRFMFLASYCEGIGESNIMGWGGLLEWSLSGVFLGLVSVVLCSWWMMGCDSGASWSGDGIGM